MNTIRILHVDDEPDICEVVELSLRLDATFATRNCGSGKEALTVAAEWQPDIILLDVMMPVLDGPATLVQLQNNARTASIPVIFMTARAQIGAGNTAMDAMRVSRRLGADKVYCVYRRSRTECPARAEEVHHAEEEGIEFHWLTAPVEILDDGKGNVRAMRCIRMELGEPDDSGRRRPIPVAGSEFEFETDQIVFAIGTNANPIIGQTSHVHLNKRGYIGADETLATSIAGVFAGGDIVTGAATVIEAMGAGRKAARSMKNYLRIRDSGADDVSETGVRTFLGIDLRERNYARIRVA